MRPRTRLGVVEEAGFAALRAAFGATIGYWAVALSLSFALGAPLNPLVRALGTALTLGSLLVAVAYLGVLVAAWVQFAVHRSREEEDL